MNRLYLLTLQIKPLEVGRAYDKLPSHLTLMSRFLTDLAPEEASEIVRPILEASNSVELIFGPTIELGPKKVIAHMIDSPDEKMLHKQLQVALEEAQVTFQYPQFIGLGHRPHVTQRNGTDLPPKTHFLSSVVYLIEVINGQRIIRSRFNLG